jgi:LmbE family N-acetylglucosaminyl deacetylase
MNETRTLLAIAAHPSDAIDLAGGTLAAHAAAGHRVVIINLTHGALSHAGTLLEEWAAAPDLEKIKQAKAAESEEAARVLGVKEMIHMGYDDEPLLLDRKSVLAVGEKIRQIRPDIIVTHHPNEYSHDDHAVAGNLVSKSLTVAARWLLDTPLAPHAVNTVYFFGVQGRHKQMKLAYLPLAPDVVVDIEPQLELKVKAFQALKSQKNTEEIVRSRLNSMEGELGRLHGYRYAESFIALHPFKHKLLPENAPETFYTLLDKRYRETTESK